MKIRLIIIFFLFLSTVTFCQKQNYNCIVFDSILQRIGQRGEQNKQLLPLFKNGALRLIDGKFEIIDTALVSPTIVKLLDKVDVHQWGIRKDDELFHFEEINYLVDTFSFIYGSCDTLYYKNKVFIITNDFDEFCLNDNLIKGNIIFLEGISVGHQGGYSIILRNNNSLHGIILKSSLSKYNEWDIGKNSIYPAFNIVGRLFEMEELD